MFDSIKSVPALDPLLVALTLDTDPAEWASWRAQGLRRLDVGETHLSGRTEGSAVGYLWRLSVASPAEAWEVLVTRGALPLEWLDAPERRFWRYLGSASSPHPLSLRDVLVVASQWRAMLDAEAPLREAYHAYRIDWEVMGYTTRRMRDCEAGSTATQRNAVARACALGFEVALARDTGALVMRCAELEA